MALVKRNDDQLGLLALSLFHAEGGNFTLYQRAGAWATPTVTALPRLTVPA